MMMTVDEKCMRMQKIRKDRNIDEKKLQTDHYKIERSNIGMEKSKEICHG